MQLTRRSAFNWLAALAAGFWGRPAPAANPKPSYPPPGPLVIRDPWADEYIRLRSADPTNPWAGYEAFVTWFDEWKEQQPEILIEWTDGLGEIDRCGLYCLLKDLLKESKIVPSTEETNG